MAAVMGRAQEAGKRRAQKRYMINPRMGTAMSSVNKDRDRAEMMSMKRNRKLPKREYLS